ncbi:uncharacterized protein ARMOST_13361 [Armillaria ostoyae]|uniref:Uncharacterized protein n=1 Tax=Armillaria ostoyae TaxID=47428 RepID=A0A284RMJ6_ARMOS|nr:uncharacterized protein ARMOST_13361 [Armillaria ostoyae]
MRVAGLLRSVPRRSGCFPMTFCTGFSTPLREGTLRLLVIAPLTNLWRSTGRNLAEPGYESLNDQWNQNSMSLSYNLILAQVQTLCSTFTGKLLLDAISAHLGSSNEVGSLPASSDSESKIDTTAY